MEQKIYNLIGPKINPGKWVKVSYCNEFLYSHTFKQKGRHIENACTSIHLQVQLLKSFVFSVLHSQRLSNDSVCSLNFYKIKVLFVTHFCVSQNYFSSNNFQKILYQRFSMDMEFRFSNIETQWNFKQMKFCNLKFPNVCRIIYGSYKSSFFFLISLLQSH